MKNKKGLSSIVITLIMIVLSLVAVGAIWAIVSPMLGKSATDTDYATKCMGVSLEVVKLTCPGVATTNCDVIVKRTGTASTEVIAGAKVVLKDASGAGSNVFSSSANIAQLATATFNVPFTPIALVGNVKKVEVTPYFTDTSGKPYVCTTATSYSLS
jgi:hypothetical protein